jgi:hypothetical protein
MDLDKAMMILAELRESYISHAMQRNYRNYPETEKIIANRVQAIDTVLDALGGGKNEGQN